MRVISEAAANKEACEGLIAEGVQPASQTATVVDTAGDPDAAVPTRVADNSAEPDKAAHGFWHCIKETAAAVGENALEAVQNHAEPVKELQAKPTDGLIRSTLESQSAMTSGAGNSSTHTNPTAGAVIAPGCDEPSKPTAGFLHGLKERATHVHEAAVETAHHAGHGLQEKAAHVCEAAVDTANHAVAPLQQIMASPEEDPVEAEHRKNIEAIIQGFLNGRIVWREHFWRDCWFNLKQTHPILSIYCAHNMQPFSRLERLFCSVTSDVTAFGFALLLADPSSGKKAEDDQTFVASIFISVYLAIDGMIKVQAATCSCAQPGGCFHRCKGMCEGCGRFVMSFSFFAACISITVGFIVALSKSTPFVNVFLLWAQSKAISWALAVAQCVACFSWHWRSQKPGLDVSESSAYPHGREYPNDDRLMWDGDNGLCWCLRVRGPKDVPQERQVLERE